MNRLTVVTIFACILALTGCKKTGNGNSSDPGGNGNLPDRQLRTAWDQPENGLELALNLLNNNTDILGFELVPTFFDDQSSPDTVQSTHTKLGYSRVAVVNGNDDPYTIGAYDAFKAALETTPGVSVVSAETVHKGDQEFTGRLTRVKESDPDVIVLATLVTETSLLMVHTPVVQELVNGQFFLFR